MTAFNAYQKLVKAYADAEGIVSGQMFGKPCLKLHGKAFLAQHQETVVFKLNGPAHVRAIALTGAKLWDPSGKGRPMREWVALPVTAEKDFLALSYEAMAYVGGTTA